MKLAILASLFIATVWAGPLQQRKALPISRHFGGRIIAGNAAEEDQFKWQVGIYIYNEDSEFFCGGALIDTKWILTGARCVDGATSFTLRFGSNSLVSGGITREANYSVVHPDYNSLTLENDVGLVRIDDGIEPDAHVEIISLATEELEGDMSVTVSGWGSSGDWGGITSELYYINLTTISNIECRMSWGDAIPDETVCARENRNNGICTGDSGDPLVMEDESGNFIHVGIASWASAGGCDITQPSGYSRTASYVDWIKSVISQN
ncbi:brachyurin-like isoform X1 [Tenebrio molitor]|jgi:secreted trypsin-like serine protease|uniref:brachyurin-like isoform X1 n=1 Tax=Tenebrio molitor TaxID=7067 RepID=UPI001C3A6F6B|nr:unnamed protein product [Tenebrio molitor]